MSEENKESIDPVQDDENVTPQPIDPAEFEALKAENGRFKAWQAKVLEEKQQGIAKAKAAEDQIAKELAEKEGNWKELIALTKKELQEEIERRDSELQSYKQKEKDKLVMDEASKIADKLTKHAGRKSSLIKEIKDRLKFTEDGVKVVDDHGNLTTDNLDSLTLDIKKRFDWLVDAVDSSGSGAKATTSTSVRSVKDMSETELRSLYRANPEKYRELKRQQA